MNSVNSYKAELYETLSYIYKCEMTSERLAAQELMRLSQELIFSDQLTKLNFLLSEVDLSQLSSISITGLVRGTLSVRVFLPYWEELYYHSWNRLVELKKDPTRLFMGIEPPNLSN